MIRIHDRDERESDKAMHWNKILPVLKERFRSQLEEEFADEDSIVFILEVSKQDLKSIVLGYKSVKLITPHPSESYKISKNNNELIDSLLIVNVENFWKNSKFLVLEVK